MSKMTRRQPHRGPVDRAKPIYVLAGAVSLSCAQFVIAKAGMHSVDQTPGLSGIGTGLEYVAADAAVTVAGLASAGCLMRLRWWPLTAVGTSIADAVLLSLLWPDERDAHLAARQPLAFASAMIVSAMAAVCVARRRS